MGHRTNLILVDGTGYHLYYCHWCSISIPKDVFWGAQFAIPYILQQETADRENGWLDDIWSEGGLLMDTVKQVLLLYGGETLGYDVPLRRLYLELLHETWLGWDIRWAHEGIFEMADYVSVPRSKVRATWEGDDRVTNLDPPERRDSLDLVGSAILEDGKLRLYPLAGDLEWYLYRGDMIVEMVRQNSGVDTLSISEWTKEFPQGGFHVDVPKKQIAFWTAYDQKIVEQIRPAWAGWDVLWLKDEYEFQARLAEGRLQFPLRPAQDALADLEKLLMTERTSGLQLMMGLIKDHEAQGHEIQVNPHALKDDPQNVPFADKKAILDKAVAAWKQKKILN